MPISRIRPLDAKLLFDDRPYNLGETINATVELNARSEIEVREARLDLVCEEHYTESFTVNVPIGQRADTGAPSGMGGVYIPASVPKLVHKDIKETYVHSSGVFLADSSLRARRRNAHQRQIGDRPGASSPRRRRDSEVEVGGGGGRGASQGHQDAAQGTGRGWVTGQI